MRDSTETNAAGAEARGQRATEVAATDEAWRAFIVHTQGCSACRSTGLDCEPAAELKRIWRASKETAA
ncbi:hypothetical protein ABT010_13615 [Streptomyces sp. NPDC002668]|uniref:hypothetical protein n=1 Tax=Streptomyces sp. NPDC002668 TaxID=3154422 RepID=UPI003330BD5B